ncbi:Putative D-alanyl-D-alanine carboxypeptidase [Geodia barretti]|nr:Putative D-alanyl-D-alanine carboxypeptidase [Geodia barretti]
MFDLASLTKVLATTTASMILYQRGHLDLDMKVSDPELLGPDFARNGKEAITVRNLLLHNAGFPPDPKPNYWDVAFGCPQTAQYYPKEDFSCQAMIYAALLNQSLQYSPGTKYIYSDLSMITMMHVVGTLARDHGYVEPSDLNVECVHHQPNSSHSLPYLTQCYYEAFVRRRVAEYLGLQQLLFLPPRSPTWALTAPTWNDTVYRHQVMQGFVSDGNSYALGGISGHAGLFSRASDIHTLLHHLMFASSTDLWINSTTVHTFTTVYNTSQSSRALGWDTNNYHVKSTDERLCGALSSETFTHTGYTGTQVCCDPVGKVITILLTNRCYKTDSIHTKELIALTRRLFNDAVVQVLH